MYVWLDATHYYATSGDDGVDGIVYSDRTPQVDYWEVRKVIFAGSNRRARTDARIPGAANIPVILKTVTIFAILRDIKLNWTLQGQTWNSSAIRLASFDRERAPARNCHHSQSRCRKIFPLMSIPWEARCVDETGYQFYERTFQLAAGQ